MRLSLLDLLYPPRCLHCRVQRPATEIPLCVTCLRRLSAVEALDVSNRLQSVDPEGACLSGRALWLFEPGGPLQTIQHALKYGDLATLGLPLGGLMGRDWLRSGAPLPDLIVPVPLHRTRLMERGYNQSAFLARGMADVLSVEVLPSLLRRSRRTQSQTTLHRADRWLNVSGSFNTTETLHGQQVLLVDDVLTTGATIQAAADALRGAGAGGVQAGVLALAPL